MKFYVIETNQGSIVGCELTKKAATAFMASIGYEANEYSIEMVNVPITVDSVRRLLGNIGGYAVCK